MEKIGFKRRGIRSACTKLADRLENLLNQDEIETSAIKTLIDMINDRLGEIASLSESILNECEDEESFANEYESIGDYEIKVKLVTNKAKLRLDQVSDKNSVKSVSNSNVRLPVINLPKFDNTVTGWAEFFNAFHSAVHSRNDLSNVQKFTYLKGQLKDEAYTLVKSLPLDDSTYLRAIDLLKTTYSNKIVVALEYVSSIQQLKIESHTATAVRLFRAKFENIIAGFSLLNYNIEGNETAEVIITALLISKMPKSMSDNLFRTSSDDIITLSGFRNALEKELILLQSSVINKPQANQFKQNFNENYKNKGVFQKYGHREEFKQTGNFATSSKQVTSSGSKPKNSCLFCNEAHTATSCTKYLTLDDRRSRLRTLKRCMNCLLPVHFPDKCKENIVCFACSGKHVVSVCPVRLNKQVKSNEINTSSYKASTSSPNAIQMIQSTNLNVITRQLPKEPVVLPGIKLPVYNRACKKKGVYCRLNTLLDQGSERTFIMADVADKLNLPIVGQENITISTLTCKGKKSVYNIVDVPIKQHDSGFNILAIVVEELPVIKGIYEFGNILNKMSSKMFMAETPSFLPMEGVCKYDLLVGGDYFYKIVNPHENIILQDGMHFLPTFYGYVLTGHIPNLFDNYDTNVVNSSTTLCMNISLQSGNPTPWTDVEKLWVLDSIGISINESLEENNSVYDKFKETIYHDGVNYVVRLPWKMDNPPLANHFAIAKARLKSSLKQLEKKNLIDKYEDIFQEQIIRNFIEKVPIDEVTKSTCHYIPHHPVVRDHHTTAVRIVFDCSCRLGKDDYSLNDCLDSGPSFVPEIASILLRFRQHNLVCASDISKAFLCVCLNPLDRDYTRFLWPKDPYDPNSSLLSYRFKVVLFGATSSPFLLQATIKHHVSTYEPQFGISNELLVRNLYVDNLHGGFDDEESLINFYKESLCCYNQAGLPLKEWISNSQILNDQAKSDENFYTAAPLSVKILGLMWNSETDVLFANDFKLNDCQTKRQIVSDAGKIFDPLGFFFPLVIRTRMLIQQLWKCKLDWDSVVSEDHQNIWNKLKSNLEQVKSISIPRCVIPTSSSELHLFSDASNLAYGCCAYIKKGEKFNLVMAKARVAPLKELTIPKLELTASILSVRLAEYIIKSMVSELFISDVHLWIDSKITLCWLSSIQNHKNLYIKNRVAEFKNKLPGAILHYIPTAENPADLLTKDVDVNLINNKLWWHGPEILTNNSLWEVFDLKNQSSQEMSSAATDVVVHENHEDPSGLPNCERFNSWSKLMRVTSYVKRIVQYKQRHHTTKNIAVEEFNDSEILWLKQNQISGYSKELEYLQGKTAVRPPLVNQLWLFLDNGLIKIKSRIVEADVHDSTSSPILLSANHYTTKLIVLDSHEKTSHGSVTDVMAHLRLNYWLPKCRQVISRILRQNDCPHCKRLKGTPYNIPITPSLPVVRVNEAIPFQFTGVDMTGGLSVKTSDGTSKRYIILFTCMSTRAIHLELAEDASAEAFARVFRRFVARRSIPQTMFSDHGSNFLGHVSILEELQNHSVVQDLLLNFKTTWKFIPARSPHFGGVWERMIGITKNVLKRVLGTSFVTVDGLNTIIVEIESKINNRPLTYISNNDCLDPLTPSHLLCGRNTFNLPSNIDEDEMDETFQLTPSRLQRSHKHILTLINKAWDKWKNDYLLMLRDRDRVKFPGKVKGEIDIKPGDIVLLCPDHKNEPLRLGRVMELFPSRDLEHRVAKVKTKRGEGIYSITKLHHLESIPLENNTDNHVDKAQPLKVSQPKRKAAILAKARIANQSLDINNTS